MAGEVGGGGGKGGKVQRQLKRPQREMHKNANAARKSKISECERERGVGEEWAREREGERGRASEWEWERQKPSGRKRVRGSAAQ